MELKLDPVLFWSFLLSLGALDGNIIGTMAKQQSRSLFPLFVAIIAVLVGYFIVSTPSGAKLPFVPDDSPTKLIPSWFVFQPRILLHEFFQAGVRATNTPTDHVMQLATSYYKSEVLYMLTHHKIFDSIGATPKTCNHVATSLDLQPHVVCEFLKAGHQLGLLTIDSKGVYSLTASGELLQTKESSLRDVALFVNQETRLAWRAAATQSAKTGKSGWEEAFDLDVMKWFEKHPEKSALKNRARLSTIQREVSAVLGDWTPKDGVFCDIGGGMGETLVYMLQHYPHMTGIVMDKTYNNIKAMQLFQETGLTSRAKFLGGFFFAPTLPKLLNSCDVFFLKHILNEFDDESSRMILEKVSAVAKPGAKVVIAERIIGTNSLEVTKSLASVNLLVSSDYGAKERTLDEYKALISAAGFAKPPNLVSLRDILSILEVNV
jgi:hypothetical protein